MTDLAKYGLDKEIFTIFTVEVVLRINYGFKVIDKFKDDNTDDLKYCPICLDALEDNIVIQPPCGHSFDYDCLMSCITEFKQFSCPECVLDLTSKRGKMEYLYHKQKDLTYPNINNSTSKPTSAYTSTYTHTPTAPQYEPIVYENYTTLPSNSAIVPYEEPAKTIMPTINVRGRKIQVQAKQGTQLALVKRKYEALTDPELYEIERESIEHEQYTKEQTAKGRPIC